MQHTQGVTIRATTLRVDGATSTHVFETDDPPLHWLQGEVGGLIDFVDGLPYTVVVNLDRDKLQLPVNHQAVRRLGPQLHGTVVVIEYLR